MKVFISWSGAKSKSAAIALRRWVPDMVQAVSPWMSEHDIDAGARWNQELSVQLEQTKFGIICLTKNNSTAPWLLFEAGALSKTLGETFVCPYLIDLEPSEIPAGPLTQFQAKRANQKETFELIASVNKAMKDGALAEDQMRRSFERWWPDLEQSLTMLPVESPVVTRRSAEEMVEEMLGLVRGLVREQRRSGRSLLTPRGFRPGTLTHSGLDGIIDQTIQDERQLEVLRAFEKLAAARPDEEDKTT